MKIIEAMKKVKENKEKIGDLQKKIRDHCANLSFETPPYGEDTPDKIREWAQSCEDLCQDNVGLLVQIARTNAATQVTIEIVDGKPITKSISEWIWRRREYAGIAFQVWEGMGDRGLREGHLPVSNTGAEPVPVKIVRHFDVELRDKKKDEYRSEPHRIDAALEVVNAVTDLLI